MAGQCAESKCLTGGHSDPILETACSELLSVYLRYPTLGQNDKILGLIIGQNERDEGDDLGTKGQVGSSMVFQKKSGHPDDLVQAREDQLKYYSELPDLEVKQEIDCWNSCNDLYKGNRGLFEVCIMNYCSKKLLTNPREKKSPDTKTCGEVYCQDASNHFQCLAEHCRYN